MVLKLHLLNINKSAQFSLYLITRETFSLLTAIYFVGANKVTLTLSPMMFCIIYALALLRITETVFFCIRLACEEEFMSHALRYVVLPAPPFSAPGAPQNVKMVHLLENTVHKFYVTRPRHDFFY